MSEKPKRRLVSKGRYVWLMTQKAILNIGALQIFLLSIGGGVCCALVVGQNINRFMVQPWWEAWALFYGAISFTSVLLGLRLMRKVQSMERVAPLTKRTTSTLPPEETLVRASDIPPSHQQSELLRGVAVPLSETPPEELLRATTNRQGD